MKRLLTAAVAAPLALLGLYFLPPLFFFFAIAALLAVAAVELANLARQWAPGAPLWLLPLCSVVLGGALVMAHESPPAAVVWTVSLALSTVACGLLVLFGRTPVPEALPALGAFAFGVPYLSVPLAALCLLKNASPHLVLLLFAVVWLGDSAAYYVGSAFGKHRLAPRVSPNKSWEGSAASLVAALAAAAVWSAAILGRFEPWVLAIAAVTSVAAQAGDLLESMLKRGAGVKDSGNIFPGHGGMLDRADALLLAAPVLFAGVTLLGERVLP